ncbi:hypothetical protein XELAEV_18036300mg [Xenopus laevis]|uniref:Ig-like domain-containing protein n=1 Tax=Xenopus laevis TaxID=8355 RepID=A0A974CHK6_XENLA|nr:hypothetical protein XELAEV_18036300mg [Xenopus laevis]
MGVRRYWFYWKYHILLAILLLHWKGRNCEEKTEALPGFKIEAPAEVTVQRGLCVLIPCNFTVGSDFTLTKDAIGIWYKGSDKGPVAASTNASQFPDTTNRRFIFTGKVSAGDCSFSISDAQPGDAAHYQFRLEGPLQFNYLHIKPKVSVTGGTGEINSLIVREGDSQEIYCKVNSNPMAKISWTKGNSRVENIKQNGQKLTLLLKNVTENNTDTYTCTAQNQRGNNNRSISVSVEYLWVNGDNTDTDSSAAGGRQRARVDVGHNSNAGAQKSQANFLVSGLCILFITLVVITTVFVFRWMRKKNDLQEDRITKEKPKSDGDVIYNNMQNISNESYMDTEETKQNKDDSDLYMNCEKELQYASIDFSKVKPKEAPQTVDITYSENIIYSEVKRN